MNDSLADAERSFEGLRHQQTLVLIEVLRSTSTADRTFVEMKYRERATGFGETLAFLGSIGAIKAEGKRLAVSNEFAALAQNSALGIPGALLRLLTKTDTPYRRMILDYIGQFRISKASVVYRPSVDSISAESGVRNYLIDLGVLIYDSEDAGYHLKTDYNSLYALALRRSKEVSPADLRRRLAEKELLGMRTEEEVLRFERSRVGPQFEHLVEHTSVRDVAAGYDILSVSVGTGGKVIPRYIEVKAVPLATYSFFWTANEREMAMLFRNSYYLYLVPVQEEGRVDVSSVRMIEDPHTSVLGPQSGWIVETDLVKCSIEPGTK